MKKKVIVIGASSGIGRSLAEYYAKAGCLVGIAARREENLKEIRGLYPHNIHYAVMDAAEDNASELLCSLVEIIGGADLVIYCSGAGKYSQVLDSVVEHQTVDVNVKGFVNIVVTAFNYFVENRGKGNVIPQIVTVSSVASVKGLGPTPSYSATKRFQTIYFEALEQRAHKIGLDITLTSVLPGFINTDFISRKYPFTMQLPYAVKCIVNAIEKRKRKTVIDWKWSVIVFFMKLIPSFLWRRIEV